jgi:hypothetical protein
MDFQKLLEQFKTPEAISFISLKRTWQRSPDEYFYEIDTSDGIYYVFEVDYIGDFNTHVLDVIREELGSSDGIIEAQATLTFEESEPVKRARVYAKPSTWSEVSKYANDKYGSQPYYFNFLIKGKA